MQGLRANALQVNRAFYWIEEECAAERTHM